MVARMRYSTTKTVSVPATINQSAHETTVATSIYDPDAAVLGHQPSGHDIYANIYNRYRVVRCIISVQVADTTGGPVWIHKSNRAAPFSAVSDFNQELKGTEMVVVATSATLEQRVSLNSIETRRAKRFWWSMCQPLHAPFFCFSVWPQRAS